MLEIDLCTGQGEERSQEYLTYMKDYMGMKKPRQRDIDGASSRLSGD